MPHFGEDPSKIAAAEVLSQTKTAESASHHDKLADNLKNSAGVARALARMNGALQPASIETTSSDEADEQDERGAPLLTKSFEIVKQMNERRSHLNEGYYNWNKMLQDAENPESLNSLIALAEETLKKLNSGLEGLENDADGTALDQEFKTAHATAEKVYEKSPSKGRNAYDERKMVLNPDSEGFAPESRVAIPQLVKQARMMKTLIEQVLPKAQERLAHISKTEGLAAAASSEKQEKSALDNLKRANEVLSTVLSQASSELGNMNVALEKIQIDKEYFAEFKSRNAAGEPKNELEKVFIRQRTVDSVGKPVFDQQGSIQRIDKGVNVTEGEVDKAKQQLLDRKQKLVELITSAHTEARGALEKVTTQGSDESKYLAGNPQAAILAQLEKNI